MKHFLSHAVLVLAAACASHPALAAGFGTFDKPFAATSPWNCRPLDPVLGPDAIQDTREKWYPQVTAGIYSTQAFKAVASDPPMTVTGLRSNGVYDADAEAFLPSVTLPHWPADTVGAKGGDGEAEVVDTTTGIVHSFYNLRKQPDGSFKAQQYTWTALAGRGFGDPAHYMQGPRSAGVSTLGGLIRNGEVDNGDPMYRHALAMSMDYTGLSRSPTYVFPATSADSDAAKANSGPFPLGSLMMLPRDYDTSKIKSVQLRKVAETLKNYGAYAVDRNVGTPFVIYVENGGTFNMSPHLPAFAKGWDTDVAAELKRIQAALRQVTSAKGWIDGEGKPFPAFDTNLNILSMRGKWAKGGGSGSAVVDYDTLHQALVYRPSSAPVTTEWSNQRVYTGVAWAAPVAGERYRFTVKSTGGVKVLLKVLDASGATRYWSDWLGDGQSTEFAWPTVPFTVQLATTNAPSGAPGTASTSLKKLAGAAQP